MHAANFVDLTGFRIDFGVVVLVLDGACLLDGHSFADVILRRLIIPLIRQNAHQLTQVVRGHLQLCLQQIRDFLNLGTVWRTAFERFLKGGVD